MGNKPTSTEEYLATLTDEQRASLETLRRIISAAAPGAEEGFSYGMPAFTLGGKPLVWVAAWKRHYSLYPIHAATVQAHAADDQPYETARGTVRFPASQALPYELIRKLVEARVAEVREAGGVDS